MTDRIIDLSQTASRVSLRNGLLHVERPDLPDADVPFEEIGMVVAGNRQLTVTVGALAALMECGAAVVVCDSRGMPCGLMTPLAGHHLSAARHRAQAAAGEPLKKRQWQALVRAKILAQAGALERLRGSDRGLRLLARKVTSGDRENMEGTAARRYWQHLFEDDPGFVRDRDKPGRNVLLNYGYAVLRSAAARAVCAAGLHPAFALHHHNRYDPFALADDLMEPLRPVIDLAVVELTRPPLAARPLDPEVKQHLARALFTRVMMDGEERTVCDVLGRMAASLAQVFEGTRSLLTVPDPPPLSREDIQNQDEDEARDS
ncbi:MAG TPA: type II CRISPR-associated endonuclease Cas1 [Candidatus Hydrogenedentes bacterium]|nr:type II CRISPR-associated endonuclease Cas1 [Candidatus Hydrogenedentota bacterium]